MHATRPKNEAKCYCSLHCCCDCGFKIVVLNFLALSSTYDQMYGIPRIQRLIGFLRKTQQQQQKKETIDITL